MWKQASVVLALAALCSANMDRMANMAMQRQVADFIMDQISGNVYDRATGALMFNIRDMLSDRMEDRMMGNMWDRMSDAMGGNMRGRMGDRIQDSMSDAMGGNMRGRMGDRVQDRMWGHIMDEISGNIKERISENMHERIAGAIHEKMASEIMGNIRDRRSDDDDDDDNQLSFEMLCKCRPGEADDDFTKAELEAWAAKIVHEEDFIRENGEMPEDGMEATLWMIKFANQAFKAMKEFLADHDHALKAAALKCVSTGDVDMEKLSESLDGDLFEGIGDFDLEADVDMTREEMMLKIVSMNFKVLMNYVKRHKFAFIALDGCRMSRAIDERDIMRAMMTTEQEMVGLNATARVALKLHKLKEAGTHLAGFVYQHRSILRIPEYCVEVARKGAMSAMQAKNNRD